MRRLLKQIEWNTRTMKTWQKRRGNTSGTSSKIVLTAQMFLGKVGEFNFITPEELFHFNDHSREEDVAEMSAFFDLVKQGHRVIITRKTQLDKGGKLYKYQNFNRSGNSDGAKVLAVGRIFDFIEGLYDNKYTTNFTYDELIEEAEQA